MTLAVLGTALAACDFAGGDVDDTTGTAAAGSPAPQAGGSGGSADSPDGDAGVAPATGGQGGGGLPDAITGGAPAAGGSAGSAGTGGTPLAAYPAGPYGFKVGEVVPNATFTDADDATVALAELRARPGVKVILWNSGAAWCTVCKAEVPQLQRLHEQRAKDGLLVAETLHQDASYKPADANTIRNWVKAYGATYPVLAEKSPPYEARAGNPLELIIDAQTMKVRYRRAYSSADLGAEITAALAAAGQ